MWCVQSGGLLQSAVEPALQNMHTIVLNIWESLVVQLCDHPSLEYGTKIAFAADLQPFYFFIQTPVLDYIFEKSLKFIVEPKHLVRMEKMLTVDLRHHQRSQRPLRLNSCLPQRPPL